MNIEEIREYCLSLPMTSEVMAFGEEYLLLRVCGKIFACIALERSESLVLKCDPAYAVELRERYREIEPAWHWNKRYWNQHSLHGSLTTGLHKVTYPPQLPRSREETSRQNQILQSGPPRNQLITE